MVRSMTGYGEAERDIEVGRLRVEVKTVNHRFLNTSIKSPPGFDRFDRIVTETLKRYLARGHVTVYLSLDRSAAEEGGASLVDLAKARAYRDAIEAVRDELDVPGTVQLEMLARFDDIFRAPEEDRMSGVEEEAVAALTETAAAAVRALREAEGERLEADLRARLDGITSQLDVVERRAPERLLEHHEKLRAAVQELTEQVEVDEDRLAREIAYLAERWDLNEEVVRCRSHVELFREALESDGTDPVGKRLGFLVQEMLREANTIGSKANDAEITGAALALKEEIEKIREQVENVE
jgi:uncharacterized protein (TIGR00255 family)